MMPTKNEMTFSSFSKANLDRCTSPEGFNHRLQNWTLSDWMTATVGELGEAANIAKKINRDRDGIKGNKESAEELRAALADELADTYIYLDLLAQSAGIRLEDAIRRKFNQKSSQIGYSQKL